MKILKVKKGFSSKSLVSILLICSMFMSNFSVSFAQPTINIYIEKEIYNYGDFFTFTLEVSEVTGEFAILHIIDEAGKRSSAIPITVGELNTVVQSPFPFESTFYPQGKYRLEIQYSGSLDSTEFELIDSGNIVIPLWVREFANYWYKGEITDIEFANAVEFLIKEGIIIIPESENQQTTEEIKIPNWVKKNAGWWIEGKISDNEFAAALEYLIKTGIIQV